MNKLQVVASAKQEIEVLVALVQVGTMDVPTFVDKVDMALNPVRDFALAPDCEVQGDAINDMFEEIQSIIPLKYRWDVHSEYWYASAMGDLEKMDIMDDEVYKYLYKAINAGARQGDWESVHGCFNTVYFKAIERIAAGYENPKALAQRAMDLKIHESNR
jgi:sarcosine oxidase delta subunit